MHLCQPYAQQKVSIPIIHIASATAKAIINKGISKVGLLGTKYTMEKDFYESVLKENDIETIIPNEKDREIIHRVIYEELAFGELKESSKQQYLEIIQSLKAKKIRSFSGSSSTRGIFYLLNLKMKRYRAEHLKHSILNLRQPKK